MDYNAQTTPSFVWDMTDGKSREVYNKNQKFFLLFRARALIPRSDTILFFVRPSDLYLVCAPKICLNIFFYIFNKFNLLFILLF